MDVCLFVCVVVLACVCVFLCFSEEKKKKEERVAVDDAWIVC